MIAAKRSSYIFFILLILSRSKVFHCQDYDVNSIEFDHLQTTKKASHTHRHHQKHYYDYDDDTKLTDFDQDYQFSAEIEEEIEEDRVYENYDAKVRQFLLKEDDRWPTFEEIERLAGVSEWKKERWKLHAPTGSTQKPQTARVKKFTYRRVQGVSGNRRNAIIAVSAIAPGPKK